MTLSSRRNFLKTTVAAAAAAAAAGTRVPAQTAATATLELTIRGLCALVKTSDGIDILLPTAPGHIPTLTYPAGSAPISDHAVTLSGLPSGSVALPQVSPCSTGQLRWFADLRKLFPKHSLVKYPEPKAPRHVASFLRISGGSVDLVVSNSTAVPGIDGIWDLVWASNKATQLLVEVATYTATVPAGPLTVTLTPMNGSSPRTINLPVAAGQKLVLTISNDTPPRPRNNIGYLQHFNHHAQIFDPGPASTKDPVTSGSCAAGPNPLTAPTGQFLAAVANLKQKRVSANSTVPVGGQVWLMTADDPICPIAYYEP